MGEGKHAGPASRWWHCGKEQRPQCLWKVAGNDSHGVGSTRDVFLIYTYKIRISLTHCKPIFPYAPCWPVFFVFFFKGAAHGQKPLVSMFHWPSERSKLHRRAWLQWHRQCQRHHGNKRTTWSQKSLATGAIRFSWLDKLRQTWCFADILYQCWINDGSSNHSTTRQHLRLLHILHICIYFVSSHNSRITRVEILIPMETKHLLKRNLCACPTCTSRSTSFGKPRTAQRCLGREFTAAVITSCTRRWEIALQAAGGLFKEVFPDISSMCSNHWSWFLALASGFIDSDYCKTCMLFSKLSITRRAWIIYLFFSISFSMFPPTIEFQSIWFLCVSHPLQSGGKRACGFVECQPFELSRKKPMAPNQR